MKIGFIGCGKMAGKMAEEIIGIKECELFGCASRNPDDAIIFKNKYKFKKSYANYDELVHDEEIELVYISVVTKAHYETMKLCIKNHKNVLCEKPCCLDANQTKEIIDLAKSENVFLAEAMWTRYMDVRKQIQGIIDGGEIGEPYLFSSSIGYHINDNPRMQDPCGGGVLLDCGIYPLNFSLMFCKDEVKCIHASTILFNQNVDNIDFVDLRIGDKISANFYCTMESNIDCSAFIYCTNGYLKLDHVNHPTVIEVFSNDRPPRLIEKIESKPYKDGYGYQWLECIQLIKDGKKESISMPLKETLRVMQILDKIREKAGISFIYE